MRNRLLIILAHVTGWLFFFSLVFSFIHTPADWKEAMRLLFSMPFLFFCFVYLFVFYFNIHVLIPTLYFKGKLLAYAITILAFLVIVFYLKPFDNLVGHTNGLVPDGAPPPPPFMDAPPPPDRTQPVRPRQMDIVSIFLFVTAWSLSTAMTLARQWRVTEKKAIQAEADKANAELSFLKAQVNPHFLFNTLNNIYSLVITRNERAAEGILKLSNIMRYITDEVKADFVALESEISCLNDYIDLQKLRLGEKTTVTFELAGETVNKKIAPLLLMTFIENAFKYGTSNHEDATIVIKLFADEFTTTFYCKNRLFESKKITERTGTGIENARQRLQYLYANKYLLDINSGNGFFTVQLTLQT
jgi:hypothetical protein